MTRIRTVCAVLLVALGLAIPAGGVASALVGGDHANLSAVTQGVWALKLSLVLHGVLLWVVGRLPWPAASREPLARVALRPDADRVPGEPLWLGAIIVAAFGLRLYDLGNGLWLDEIAALVKYVRLPVGQLLATFDSQNQHMLFALLARGSIASFGDSAWALRLPAVLFGVGSIAALFWFGVRVGRRREALLAAAILAVSYHHVWFSQNARGYSGLLMWTLLGSGLFLQLLATRDQRRWSLAVGYAATMALAAYTHATAVLVVAAHGLIWAALMWPAWKRADAVAGLMAGAGLLLAGTFTLLLYSLVLPQFFATLSEPTMAGFAVEWKSPFWLLAETARGLGRALPGGWVALAAGLVVAVAGLSDYVRGSKVTAAVMVLPPLLTAAALLATRHNLWPRFFFFAGGFAVLIAVRGIFVLSRLALKERHPRPATAVAVLVIVASIWMLPSAYGPKQDFEGAREYVREARGPADAIIALDLAGFPIRDYLAEDWPSVADGAELQRIERAHPRTWVLYTFPARLAVIQPDVWERLQESYATAAEFPGTVGGGTVVIKVYESDKG